ncbi:MAG: hypothetical protein HYZ85_05605 [Candidatus Omnitrophica bacterium]|nr:hypothetical protein [Candidatus Omnitrophota bacterium]
MPWLQSQSRLRRSIRLSRLRPPSKGKQKFFNYFLPAFVLALFIWGIVATELLFQARQSAEERALLISMIQTEREWDAKEIARLRSEKEALENKLREKNQEIFRARSTQKRLISRWSFLRGKYTALKRRFKNVAFLPNPVRTGVKPRLGISNAPEDYPLEGKILNVNPVYEFVVIDRGSENGLRLGDKLYVIRQGAPLKTELIVDRMYDYFSACQWQDTSPNETLQVGDKVARFK